MLLLTKVEVLMSTSLFCSLAVNCRFLYFLGIGVLGSVNGIFIGFGKIRRAVTSAFELVSRAVGDASS